MKKVEYKEESYYQFDLYKIRKHFKLNEEDITILKILKIVNDDKKPEKIKMKDINDLINRV